MKRRDLLKNMALYMLALPGNQVMARPVKIGLNRSGVLNAFYIRAHTYTLVPKHVRYDLDWMASIGTNALTLSVIEQDLKASKANIRFIVDEAHKREMAVYMIPARWAGLFAGGAKVPSIYSVRNPHTWRKDHKGEVVFSNSTGVISSIHYPEVAEFIVDNIIQATKLWNLDGVVWDEPKIWGKDYSHAAKKLKNFDQIESHYLASVNFMNSLSFALKNYDSNLKLHFYAGADLSKQILKFQRLLTHIDYFGCSGLPWPSSADKTGRNYKRYLVDKIPQFKNQASDMGVQSMAVIKNMFIEPQDHLLADRYLPDTVELRTDNLSYYYYPRNLKNPDANMNLLKEHLQKYHA